MQKKVLAAIGLVVVLFLAYRYGATSTNPAETNQADSPKYSKLPSESPDDAETEPAPEAMLELTISANNAEQLTQQAGQMPGDWPKKYNMALVNLYEAMIDKCKGITGADEIKVLEDCALIERNRLFKSKPMTVKEFISSYTN